ncbi:MAG: hypothetical protein LBH00_04880 [Planctomycetaceae bacterium]|jgi:deoxyribose-phosphate aldolase|nr:hypothetical protein [Planctomycetaceae bacterium]
MPDLSKLDKRSIGKFFDYSVLPKQSTEKEICPARREAVKDNCNAFYTASRLIAETGASYAKTSTGQFEGPDRNQFLLMKETLKDTGVKLKVAGVKFPRPQNAYTFILAGAELSGTRAAPEIIDVFDPMKSIGLF